MVGTVNKLDSLFARCGRAAPSALESWESRVQSWCGAYESVEPNATILEFDLEVGVYLFDQTLGRVVLAYAVSCPALHKRDAARMRGFPDVSLSVRSALGERAFLADRGHFLGHASGGQLDVNLFPQSRTLNRGWSEQGKIYRRMERFVAANLGTFFYHRPVYDDSTWIPRALEYGVLRADRDWWTAEFDNRK